MKTYIDENGVWEEYQEQGLGIVRLLVAPSEKFKARPPAKNELAARC